MRSPSTYWRKKDSEKAEIFHKVEPYLTFRFMEILGEKRVFSCDHVAINDKVTACDMKSVPLPDGSLDVVVFSLSLMGKNWVDYILEAKSD